MHDCPNSRASQDKVTWFDPFHLICQLSGQKQYRDSQTSSSSLPWMLLMTHFPTMQTCTSGKRRTMTPATSVGMTTIWSMSSTPAGWQGYNERHDAVLALLYEVVKEHLPDTTSSTVDLISSDYSFPCHIVATDWDQTSCRDETANKVSLIELTVCFDTLFEGAIKRKEDRYQELLDTIQDAGYTASLVTVEVGSRGIPNPTSFLKLKTNLGLSRALLVNLMVTALRPAITESFKIWCMRNQK